jgi:hypothetical protein
LDLSRIDDTNCFGLNHVPFLFSNSIGGRAALLSGIESEFTMDVTIYRLLNADTKAWWYHKQLRERGATKEARKRERDSIRSALDTLRTAYFWSVGHGGWTIYQHTKHYETGGSSNSKRQGYGGTSDPDIAACILLGIPGYDFRTIPSENQITASFRAPLVDDEKDEPKEDGSYGSLSYAPPKVILDWYKSFGATVYNEQNV